MNSMALNSSNLVGPGTGVNQAKPSMMNEGALATEDPQNRPIGMTDSVQPPE